MDAVTEFSEKVGYKVVIQKSGHSFIKKMMLETNASLGGEVSGHIFFPFSNSENTYIPYDDAVLAACYMLKFFLSDESFFIDCINAIPKTFAQYDIKIKCQKNLQNKVMKSLIEVLKAHQMDFIDIGLPLIFVKILIKFCKINHLFFNLSFFHI